MDQQELTLSVLGEQQSSTRDQGLDAVGNFNQLAAANVQAMLNKLIADHQSIVQSLQAEIALLRQKHSDPDGKLASPREPCVTDSQPHATDLQLTSSDSPTDRVVSTDCASGTATSATTKEILKRGQSCKDEFYFKMMPCEPESSKTVQESALKRSESSKMLQESEFDDALMLSERSEIEPIDNPSSPCTTDAGNSASKVSAVLLAIPSLVRNFVFSNKFELITGFVIVCNTIVMAMQQQYNGFDMGYAIRPDDYSKPAGETWPGGDIAFSIADTVFNVLFFAELVLRFYANGVASICMPWMWFDTTVVVLGLLDSLLSEGGLGLDPSMIRLVRLVRLIRLLKIFKSMSHFDSLFLLVKAIRASVGALIWSLLLLGVVMMGAALLLGQILGAELMDTQKDMKVRDQLFMYFGTFSRAMMTMVEITLGNWVPSCRLLMENVHEAFFVFFLVYRCMFCFSVLRVINAVFISETNRVLASDVDLTVMKGERDHAGYKRQLRQVLTSMDFDGSGTVSGDEVQKFMDDPQIRKLLHTIGFSRKHVEKVFWIVAKDDVDGPSANIDDLVREMLSLKGNARPVDIHCIDKKVQMILRWVQAQEQYNGKGCVGEMARVQVKVSL